MRDDKPNVIVDLSFEFSILAIAFCENLESQRKFVVSNQLIKSATSIGANVREAQNAEIEKDFLHKIKIAAKEADETEYWLLICEKAYKSDVVALLARLTVIIKILSKIISSIKKNALVKD